MRNWLFLVSVVRTRLCGEHAEDPISFQWVLSIGRVPLDVIVVVDSVASAEQVVPTDGPADPRRSLK